MSDNKSGFEIRADLLSQAQGLLEQNAQREVDAAHFDLAKAGDEADGISMPVLEITAEEIRINKILETEEGGLFQKLGVNTQLGKGVFNWSSLYNSEHTPIVERIPIDTGRKDEDGNAILINTLRSGMGALGNLDIMGYRSGKLDNFRGFDRGDEPYIIQDVGSDRYRTLSSRDGFPLHRAKDDFSRLLKFYGSGAGLAFIAKENIKIATKRFIIFQDFWLFIYLESNFASYPMEKKKINDAKLAPPPKKNFSETNMSFDILPI